MALLLGKGGKSKQKKKNVMSLDEFLGDTKAPEGFDKKNINWADMMADEVAG